FLALFGIAHAAWAEVALRNLRIWHAPERSRIVFDLDKPVVHKVFTLSGPHRLVIDLTDAVFYGRFPAPDTMGPLAVQLRMARRSASQLRFVVDLRSAVQHAAFLLPPNGGYGHRLVIDIAPGRPAPAQALTPKPAPRSGITVAIDAGHGGEDSGARGARGTREKAVVLAIAKELHRNINAEPGMRAVLTRSGDYYVSLRERTAFARKHNADLFVSIHADAFPQRSVKGSSVYALSSRGATSEAARWLAGKENASDLAGGVSISDKDDTLAAVLLDLSMTKTIEHSLEFARDILSSLAKVGPVHSRRVEQAGFVVLKSPDIPSVLVEVAYISNRGEERKLRTRRFQKQVADAMLAGIRTFVKRNRRRFVEIGGSQG
ncbi:MAG: N-acetylmuramoyl-L-alanine amidase, partial [Gammaproteobacteria bacterium]|nr:N-acetylmuramoyl-L-alanine amidase [Gammaproteobacteria bacterium]